jgi:hypothetical protein
VPAREPNGNPETDQSNFGLNAENWLPAQNFGTAQVVRNGSYIDPSGKNVTIDRGGMFDQYYMGVGGPADNFVPSVSYWVRCAFFGRNLHSMMPLDPTHVRLKRTCV